MKRYYSLYQNVEKKIAEIYIYGDITSWEWLESDVSSYTLSKELSELAEDITEIHVYINSYGGEVGEGIAIYNMLKRHNAKVITYVDSFACSIATVIFAAGAERVVYNTSLGFYHNAWTHTAGNANALRKEADDLEKITQASINAYMGCVSITEEELKTILDGETWLSADEMISMGFATKLAKIEESDKASQSVRKNFLQKIFLNKEEKMTKEEVNNIILQKINELEERLLQKKNTQQDNKPLNMMMALFNANK